MAITSATRQDIIELCVIANNAAPGTTLLASLIAESESGKSLTQIAETLAARSEFTTNYPSIQTSTEFATEFLNTLLPEVGAAFVTAGIPLVEAHINGGGSIGALIAICQDVLSSTATTDADLGTSVSNFNNKYTVAAYHTVTLELADGSSSVLSSVTSTASTVTTAKAAADLIKTPATVAAAVATYALASDVTSADEGGDIVFTLTTTNVAAGTKYSYVISGVNSSDLSSGSLTGTAEVDTDGKARVSVGLKNDTTTEGAETLKLTVAGESSSVTVNDTSTTAAAATVATPTYALTANATSVNEGATAYYTLATTNVAAGTQYSWSVTGVSSADVVGGVLAGTATIDANGDAVIGVSLVNDTLTEGSETMTLTVADKSTGVTVADTSLTAAAATATTYTLTSNAPQVTEGDSGESNLVFTITLSAAADAATVVNYETLTTGTATAGTDFTASAGTVTFGVGQSSATVAVEVNGDTTYEGNETVKVKFSGANITADVTGTGTITGDDTDPDTVAQAKTLTIGADTITTAGAADTFNGSTASTLDTGDTLDGGAGSDTLSATFSATESIRPTLTAIETVKLTATAALTIDARDITGTTLFTSESSTAAIIINNYAAVANLTINSNSGNAGATAHTINITDAAIAGAADAMTITLDNIDADTVITLTDGGGTTNELEEITVHSVGLANTLGQLASAGVETSTLNVTGDKNLVITTALDTKYDTVQASAFTGNLTVTGAATATTYTGGSGNDTITASTKVDTIDGGAGNDTIVGGGGNDIITGGAGNDTITANTGNDTIVAGAGNDTITTNSGTDNVTAGAGNDIIDFGAGNLTSVDTVAGGDGTDSIKMSATVDKDFTLVTGVETVVGNAAGTYVLGTISEAAGVVNFTADADGAYTVSASTSTKDMTITAIAPANKADSYTTGSGNDTFIFDGATGLEDGDVISAGSGTNAVQFKNAATVTAVADLDDIVGVTSFTFTDADGTATSSAEAVKLTFSDVAETITQAITADASAITDTKDTVVITAGANDETATTFTITAGASASTLTGGAGIDTITGGSAADIIDGEEGNDIISGGAGNDALTGGTGNDTITGGAGNDGITTSAGNDIVDGGAGNDTIVASGGTESLTGGAGNDTFTLTTQQTSVDTVAGGDGTDVATMDPATVDLDFTLMTGVEKVTATTGTGTWVLGSLAQAAGVTTFTGGNWAHTVTASAYTVALTVDLTAGTGTDNDTITTGSGDDILIFDGTDGLEDGDIISLGTGTDTIQLKNAAAVTAVADLDDMTGVEKFVTTDVDGSATNTEEVVSLTFSDVAETTTNAITVDASGITDSNDNVVVNAGNNDESATTFTITGGAGADTLTGGAGIDTITGGAGIDIIDGQEGNDIISGGAGNDILTGGTGNDTITGGDGNDNITTSAGNDIADGGAGNDTLIASGGTESLTGGAGNDTFTLTTQQTSLDTVAGGDGTDVATMSAATIDLDFRLMTGVEKVTANDAGAYTLGSDAQAAGVTTFTGANAAHTLQASTYTVALTVDLTAGAGTDNDTITTGSGDDLLIFDGTDGLEDGDIIDLGTGTDTIQLKNADNLTAVADLDDITGVEKFVTTDADGAATTDADPVSLTFSAISEGTIQTIIVDGSGITDSLDNFTVNAGAGTATSTFTITGGAGADILTGGAGRDTITGGTGNDTILAGAGIDIVDAGAGNDIIQSLSADLLGLDTIGGGAGTDTLSVTDASTVIDDDFTNMTSVETLLLAAAAHTVTLGASAKATGITTVTGNSDVDNITLGAGFTTNVTVTLAAGNDILDLSGYAAGYTATVDASAAGTAAISLGLGKETITGSGQVETITLGVAGGLAATDTLTLSTGTDILNITAAQTVTDAAFTLVTGLENITASAVAVNLTAGSLAEAAGVVSIILGNAANTVDASGRSTTNLIITGGTAADTLTGGAGVDTITGTGGADIITGGKGNDILVGSGGNDTYVFGSTGALNGVDVVTFVIATDKFNVSNMLSGGSMLDTRIGAADTDDVNITNKVANLTDNDGLSLANTAAKIAALIEGNGDAMKLDSGGKAIIVSGESNDTDGATTIWLVDDTLDSINGTIATGDVVQIATLATFKSLLTGDNFVFS